MSDPFTDREKRILAGRAKTLFERTASPEAFDYTDADVAETVREWKETYPSEAAFERRLSQADASEDEFRDAMRVEKLAGDEPIPEWVGDLSALTEAITSASPEEFTRGDSPGQTGSGDPEATPGNFPELSAAIAAHARETLPDDPVRDHLSDDIIASMAQWLQIRFQIRFTRILYVEFKAYVATRDRDLAFADPEEFEERPTDYYEDYVQSLFSGGFKDLCLEYPVFARLLTTQVRQWRDHLTEFCRRLLSDREDLAAQFGAGDDPGPVTELEPLADDTHGDGRAVMRVAFESGLTLAYKPRPVTAGKAFYDVLDRFNDYLDVPDFSTPTYLPRGSYGWMEWVDYDDPSSESATERYYRRAGALTCLGYFLEFSDCQFENLLVAGEHPVLVDAETVMHPYIRTENQPIRTGAGALTEDSVLLTALLPFDINDMYTDNGWADMMSLISGFAESSETRTFEAITNPEITAPNTDVMSVEHEPAEIDHEENVPTVDSEDQPLSAYVPAFIGGFETTYETIVELRDDGRLTDDVGLLRAFESVENRVVYRATVRYSSVLRSLTSMACLGDGARFSIEMEQLAVPFADGRVDGSWPWALYEAERTALKRLDPPRFTSKTDETAIRLNGDAVGSSADISGMERARNRIESADETDLREQLELVRGSAGLVPSPSQSADAGTELTTATDDGLRQEAKLILEEVQSAAVETSNGTYHWASLAPYTETERLTLQAADGSLYNGRCGIALLGAGLYQVTGNPTYRQFVEDTLRPVRAALATDRGSKALNNLGGAAGNGSVVYGLAAISDLLGSDELLSAAVRAADFVTTERIEADDVYDVTTGAAGTILGLLGAYERSGADVLVSKARECGNHLLANRVESQTGHRVWETLEDCGPLTGFAHGASGIALALSRLWETTGEPKYRDAALEAVEFEAEAFSESASNWRDHRDWTAAFFDQWCFGRSGIGIARLGMAEVLDDERIRRGYDRAISGTDTETVSEHDHVCCGNAGRAEFLLEAERRHGDCTGGARTILGTVRARNAERGYYETLTGTREITVPTFFHGCVGIGYSMLRASDPEALPCVLLWE